MGYKLWAHEEMVTSPDLNDYLMKQAVIVCTSGTRPPSPVEGMTVHETDTGIRRYYDGSNWKSITTSLPIVAVAKTTIPTIANNNVTSITWDSQIYESRPAMWGSGTNILIPHTGLYKVGISLRWASQATVAGFRQARIDVDGTENHAVNIAPTTALNATNVITQTETMLTLNAGQVVTGLCYQSSGGSLTLGSASRMWVYMIAD